MATQRIELKIVGHELVTVAERDEFGAVVETDQAKISMRGFATAKRTRATLLVDLPEMANLPLGEICVLTFTVPQQRLALEPKPEKSSAKGARASAS